MKGLNSLLLSHQQTFTVIICVYHRIIAVNVKYNHRINLPLYFFKAYILKN